MSDAFSDSLDMDTLDKVAEIMRLHDEACAAAMALDGHCKSSEGHVEIGLTNYFERRDGAPALAIRGISIYAYVVGPSRQHYFDTVDEALAAMRRWHSLLMEDVLQERREIEAENA